jgi:hypothetical protein
MKKAFIIGNGPSRKGFDLKFLKGKGTVYGCNALYRNFPKFDLPDYLVAIDEKIIEEIEKSKFPEDRFIVPPEAEQWEDPGFNPYRRYRSNAGMNAMLEAIKAGHTSLYCFGFDFMIRNPKVALGNLYDGTNAYGPETRTRYEDNINRIKYMTFLARKYHNIEFKFVVPRYGNRDEYHILEAKNVTGMFYDKFVEVINSEQKKVANA